MKTVTAREARAHFSEILNEAYYGGETILVTRSGKPLVIIKGARETKSKTKVKFLI